MIDPQDGTSTPPGYGKVTHGPRGGLPRGDLFSPGCPTRWLLDRIGDKWTSMAIKVLADSHPVEVRFSELRRRMPGISQKMLSQTLRRLGADSLIERRVEATVPPSVYYSLTPLGLSLDQPLAGLREWAELHVSEIESR
ncbi:MAG TPA: helix-turn-helix domain-containing protein [Solirubrobacterales bacterium]|nr:helix-turn-helix domain-containing protein [Solirubrobacterales bacterium]